MLTSEKYRGVMKACMENVRLSNIPEKDEIIRIAMEAFDEQEREANPKFCNCLQCRKMREK